MATVQRRWWMVAGAGLAFLALAVLAWWILQEPAAPPPSAAFTSSAPGPVARGPEADRASAGETTGSSAALQTSAFEAADEGEEFGDPEGAVLRVVRQADGTPVPGAEVLWLDWDRPRARGFASILRARDRPFRALSPLGRTLRADAQGEIRLPAWHGRADLLARRGAARGHLALGARGRAASPGTVHELEIGPPREVLVRVLDAERRPLGNVPVALRVVMRDPGEGPWRTLFDMWRVRTDREGRAAVPLLGIEQAQVRGLGSALAVGVAWPGGRAAQERIAADAPPTGEVVLTLHDFGRLELVLEAPVAMEGLLQHVYPKQSSYIPRLADHRALGDEILHLELEPGRLHRVFPVPLEREFQIELLSADRRHRVLKRVKGPTAARPARRHRLEAEELARFLRGRAVDEEGRALAGVAIGALRTKTVLGGSVTSDAAGQFALPLAPKGALDEELRLEARRAGRVVGEVLVAPTWNPTTGAQLGELVFGRAPLLAAGQVVGPEGEPVPGLRVHLELPRGASKIMLVTRDATWGRWFATDSVRTDARGRFEIRSFETPEKAAVFRVVAGRGVTRAESPELPVGSAPQDIALMWDPGRPFALRLHAPLPMMQQAVHLWIEAPLGTERRFGSKVPTAEGVEVVWDAVPEGPVRVGGHLEGLRWALPTNDYIVSPALRAEPPALDLGAWLVRVEIPLAFPPGPRPPKALLRYEVVGDAQGWAQKVCDPGEGPPVLLLPRHEPVRLEVRASGFLVRELDPHALRDAVQLTRQDPVHFVVPAAWASGWDRVRRIVVARGGRPPLPILSAPPPRAPTHVAWPAPTPGAARLVIVATDREGRAVPLRSRPFEIPARGAGRPIRITPRFD